MLHVPSWTVVANWPHTLKLGHVSDVSFSPHSGYLAVGNSAGKALLHRVLAYDRY